MINVINIDKNNIVISKKMVFENYVFEDGDIEVEEYEDFQLGDKYPKGESA